MKKLCFLILQLVFCFSFAACSEPQTPNGESEIAIGSACKDTPECVEGALCVEGVCHSVCKNPDECAQGEGCHEGVCQKCYNDDECKGGYACDVKRGICGAHCEEDKNCSKWHYCTDGGVCAKRGGRGEACKSDHECYGRPCVDGVCCEDSCTDSCMACNMPGDEGYCMPVRMGQLDDAGCPGEKACSGNNNDLGHMACDGHGQCDYFVSDRNCGDYYCVSGDSVSDEDASCAASCKEHSDCRNGKVCHNGSCISKLPLGGACEGDFMCVIGGMCVNGICCDNKCDVDCKFCNKEGHCQPVADGETDGACDGSQLVCHDGDGQYFTNLCDGKGACSQLVNKQCGGGYLCNGNEASCYQDCLTTNLCQVGFYCDTNSESPTYGSCLALHEQGEICDGSNIKCAAGLFCVDGYCCDTQCGGLCEACNVPGKEGTCSAVVNSLDDSCQGDKCVFDGEDQQYMHYTLGCDENSTCAGLFMQESCGNYDCAVSNKCNTGCKVTCENNTIIENGCNGSNSDIYCKAPDGTPAFVCGAISDKFTDNGTCVYREKNGTSCLAGRECQSGNCVDGTCCNASTCKTTCSEGNQLTLRNCGSGQCEISATVSCTGHLRCADANSCKDKCTVDGDCLDGYYCDGNNICQKKLDNGAEPAMNMAGLAAVTCTSGFVSDGVCCDKKCDGACESCALEHFVGTCKALADGTQPEGCQSECGEAFQIGHAAGSYTPVIIYYSLLTKRKCQSGVCQSETLDRSVYACLPDLSGYYTSCSATGRSGIRLIQYGPLGEEELRERAGEMCHANYSCHDGTYGIGTMSFAGGTERYEHYSDGVCY